ncbi:hypothetical protein GEMRC1_009852 [Eukaryota sp. GEM-RC1]
MSAVPTPQVMLPRSIAVDSRKQRKSNTDNPKKSRSDPPFATKKVWTRSTPNTRLSDLGGLDCISDIQKLIINPFRYASLYSTLNVSPPRGILLTGPPGSGKSVLANALGGELLAHNVAFYKITAPEIVSGMSGESESNIRSLFEEALKTSPSLIFIDEIDAIAPKRDSTPREMEKRIVSQLSSSIDFLNDDPEKVVVILAATSRPESIDPSLRRTGRFDREVCLKVPSKAQRCHLLQVLTQKKGISLTDDDINDLAQKTPGYVGADVEVLIREAGWAAVERMIVNQESKMNDTDQTPPEVNGTITIQDFYEVLPRVQPTAKGKVSPLSQTILEPIRCPEKFEALGLSISTGVLLYGPPGCGKTLLAKAIANESGANFIYVKGPELLNKYVGESERAVRSVFERSRVSAPCVVFFDELDALCPKRSGEGNQASERVVNQLLTEMDGLDSNRQVFVIAATNRPDIIDAAMLRPGRLDLLLYVPLPGEAGRRQILHKLTKKLATSDLNEFVIEFLAQKTQGFSGADLSMLVREACLLALKENLTTGKKAVVTRHHFLEVVNSGKVSPSVSESAKRKYENMTKKIRQCRVSDMSLLESK